MGTESKGNGEQCIVTVSKCFQLQMARMEIDPNLKILANFFKLYCCLRKKSNRPFALRGHVMSFL